MNAYPKLIVGIGASAGGLKPIEEFFDNMPNDTGMAFVIVQHLSPDFKSLMDELLGRHTEMAIHKVNDGVLIEPNSIYLIPPEKNMAIMDGKLMLSEKAKKPNLHLPIDNFFQSLAEKLGKNSAAIVLSGTGSDGSRGIKHTRQAGGLVIVQHPETAGFDGMPRAAIATGIVDLICEPAQMPERLIQYQNDFDRVAVQQTEFEDLRQDEAGKGSEMLRLYRHFRHRKNVDFSLYKSGTIHRRLERRMRMSSLHSLDEYFDKLESEDDESDLLFHDLLVLVTQFFRDADAFVKLRKTIIPEMIQNAESGSELRIWICGCATGEEAYSISILMHDGLEKLGRKDITFKIFATDINKKSLEIASGGFYPSRVLDDVPKDLREKYFVEANGICSLRRELRQPVIFACNDFTKDPPFTRLDLICCRNVLIYLEPKVQKRILSTFHFGLKTKGVLFLGPSETVGDLTNEFEQLDRHWRIYSKRRDVRLPEVARLPLTPALSSVVNERARPFVEAPNQIHKQVWLTNAYEQLLAKHVPPSILVNELHELVHCFGDTRRVLHPPEGKPSNDVLKMLEKNLGVSVSAALHRAKTEGKPVVYRGVRVHSADGNECLYQVSVEPYNHQDQSLYLISLEATDKVSTHDQIVEDFHSSEQSHCRIEVLECELNHTRETLQATVEELESSNEELQTTNEELIASNEELQSTNEELHSVNEEIHIVNSEYKAKIEELTQLTSDMDNLLKSTEIGTIFLDREFNIRMFTPAISAGFSLMNQDIGRPISHIAYKLDNPRLLEEVAEVLKTGVSKELEVSGKTQRVYFQRIQPYRVEDKIDGVVLTLTDITELRDAQKATKMLRGPSGKPKRESTATLDHRE